MGRVAIFIDGAYFKEVLKSFGAPRISYELLSEFVLNNGEERLRTYYYDCPPFEDTHPDENNRRLVSNFEKFINAVEKIPRFQTRLGRLTRYATLDGYKYTQKEVDILLAVDLVRLACRQQIHRAVIVGGDSDFVPAIDVAKEEGVIISLLYFNFPKPHDELLQACDERHLIDHELIDRIRLVHP